MWYMIFKGKNEVKHMMVISVFISHKYWCKIHSSTNTHVSMTQLFCVMCIVDVCVLIDTEKKCFVC